MNPQDPNDPVYAKSPDWVFINGWWTKRGDPNKVPDTTTTKVTGDTLGTPGGFSDVMAGLGDRIAGTPFEHGSGRRGGMPTLQIGDLAAKLARYKQLSGRLPQENTFDRGAANQSVGAQLALMQQMQAAQSGPSLAGMQGQQGMSRLGQQALMRGGRAGMLGAQGSGGGMAADVGRARLAEAMQQQAGLGSTAGGLEGRELSVQRESDDAQLRADALENSRIKFYSGLGQKLGSADKRLSLENLKLDKRIGAASNQATMDSVNSWLNFVASGMGQQATGKGGAKGGQR